MIRLLVADDHPVIRKGIREIFHESDRIEVAGEAKDWKEILNKIGRHKYDVLLLDIKMPGRSGLDILPEIKIIQPKLPVIIFSVFEDEEYVIKAINLGASGFLSKASEAGEMIKAIETVAGGNKYITGELASKLLFAGTAGIVEPLHNVLSKREMEVLVKIASGSSARQIAQDLSIHVKTVNAHREHILKKMHMKSNAELVKYAVNHRIV